MSSPRLSHDEEELELPPLDGALEGEEKDGEGAADDDEIDDEPALRDDDGAAFDLDPASEIEPLEDIPGGGDAEREIDIGSLADSIALPDEGAAATDDRGLSHEEEEVSPFDAQGSDETGTGTGDDLSGFVEESALPPLGDDDEEAHAPQQAAIEERGGRWERGRYRIASGLGAEVPCWLLSVSSAHVVAAGAAVLVVSGGARTPNGSGPDIDAVAVAAADGALFAVSRRGALFASLDGGDSWSPAGALRSAALEPVTLAATPGRLWICQGGALWSLRWSEGSRPEPQVLVRKEGVRAVAAAGSALVLLDDVSGAPTIERLRGDDEASAPCPLPPWSKAAEGPAPVLAAAAGGRAVALLEGNAVLLSRDGGSTFRRHDTGTALAAAFAGTGVDAPLMVLAAGTARGSSGLLEIDESGTSTRVAEVAASGRAALAWDAEREVLWVACSAGLLAFERSAQH